MALAAFRVTNVAAKPKYVMPRELVEHAREIGCAQIDDFYDIDGMIGPPYVYGYIPGREEKSAAFWCQKTKVARGERAIHNAIRDSKPGQDTTFYCHERRWLVRSRH